MNGARLFGGTRSCHPAGTLTGLIGLRGGSDDGSEEVKEGKEVELE